jgi:hypothetical protein
MQFSLEQTPPAPTGLEATIAGLTLSDKTGPLIIEFRDIAGGYYTKGFKSKQEAIKYLERLRMGGTA